MFRFDNSVKIRHTSSFSKLKRLMLEVSEHGYKEEVEDMLRLFRQMPRKAVKKGFTGGKHDLTGQMMPEFSIVINDEEIEAVKRAKGWDTDADMARGMGLTRQRISQIRRTKKASIQFIGMFAYLTGNLNGPWWQPFNLVISDWHKSNHQKWNMSKYDGEIPYGKGSLSASFRRQDGPAETW